MSSATPIDGSNKGYIRLHRTLLDSTLFKDKPAGWLKIWIYLNLRANWRESIFRPRQGESIVVPAGSMITSLEKLGTHAALSKEHARRCLEYLERTQTVILVRTHHWTMVTIVNWDVYQRSEEEADHAEHHAEHHSEFDDATRETPHRTPRAATPSKEVKNLGKKYNSNSNELDSPTVADHGREKPAKSKGSEVVNPAVQEWFDTQFWPVYPRHEGKQAALKAANDKATTTDKRAYYLRRLKSQLRAYQQRKSEGGQRVIPMGATWFNQDRAEDELELTTPAAARMQRPAQGDYPDYVPLAREAM